jgi:hypothetical protein
MHKNPQPRSLTLHRRWRRPDVRFVLHFTMPSSVEAYYQEVGRAGRDGAPARCELLFDKEDISLQEYFIYVRLPLARNLAGSTRFVHASWSDRLCVITSYLRLAIRTAGSSSKRGAPCGKYTARKSRRGTGRERWGCGTPPSQATDTIRFPFTTRLLRAKTETEAWTGHG